MCSAEVTGYVLCSGPFAQTSQLLSNSLRHDDSVFYFCLFVGLVLFCLRVCFVLSPHIQVGRHRQSYQWMERQEMRKRVDRASLGPEHE